MTSRLLHRSHPGSSHQQLAQALHLCRVGRVDIAQQRTRLKALERENRELRQANEILRKASAYFALAELDRRHKP